MDPQILVETGAWYLLLLKAWTNSFECGFEGKRLDAFDLKVAFVVQT